MNKEIGNRIKKIRYSKGLNSKNVADAVGILDTSLSKIEREGTNSLETLLKIAKALDVNPCEFFEDKIKTSNKEFKTDHNFATKTEMNEVKYTMQQMSKTHDHYNKPKVIMPMYGKVAVVDYSHKLVSAGQEKTATGKLTGHNVMTVLTNSDAESESLVQILDSRLQRFFNTVTCETRSPYVNFLKNFVGVPLNKKYTNDELETALRLSPEEKDWIRANF